MNSHSSSEKNCGPVMAVIGSMSLSMSICTTALLLGVCAETGSSELLHSTSLRICRK